MSNGEWKPWEESNVWRTKAEFFTWLRGQIRKSIWQRYPPRNEFKSENLRPATKADYDAGLSRRSKKLGKCTFCQEWFPASKLQVDHIIPAGSLRNEEDMHEFIKKIACMKENMRLTCEPCHKIVTYQERNGITFEEARMEKEVIAFSKLTPDEQKSILKDWGHSGQSVSSGLKRKNLYRTLEENS